MSCLPLPHQPRQPPVLQSGFGLVVCTPDSHACLLWAQPYARIQEPRREPARSKYLRYSPWTCQTGGHMGHNERCRRPEPGWWQSSWSRAEM